MPLSQPVEDSTSCRLTFLSAYLCKNVEPVISNDVQAMGNQHSHGDFLKKDKASDAGSTSGSIKQKDGPSLSRSASGADIQETKYSTHLLPIDKLAKVTFGFDSSDKKN